MNFPPGPVVGGNWKQSILWLLLTVGCFQTSYISLRFPAAGVLILGFAYFLVRLAQQPTLRRAFYFGLAAGFLCYAPQLYFFWNIFGVAAIVLWLILAFWMALFSLLACRSFQRWGPSKACWQVPVIWTGLEYFRSELYYLKFSWLNVGYALPVPLGSMGMYGAGFLAFTLAATLIFTRGKQFYLQCIAVVLVGLFFIFVKPPIATADAKYPEDHSVEIVGVQMEFPSENLLPRVLTAALQKNPSAPVFVLSEYTLDGGVTDALKKWCRTNARYLVVGGKDQITPETYYNTAFVVGTNGDVIFQQAKSVPIQFFTDGLPAQKQAVWLSPWGKIGLCICYDLSYTRVTDQLIREGAQLLIVPTMDVSEWGRHQHELHSRVAPLRAAEYGIPIFRLASSGISQAVEADGTVTAKTHIGGMDEVLSARLTLPPAGRIPWDRYLAPLCSGLVIFIILAQLIPWRNPLGRRSAPKTQ